MLSYAAVCPHPPLLVPELAGEAAPELDALRASCRLAVQRLARAVADGASLVVVGGDAVTRTYGPDSRGTLRRYGLDLSFGGGGEELPLSLSIGRWLLDEYADNAIQAVHYQGVAFDAPTEECLRLGRDVARHAERVALLVMGDGSACLNEKAPGYLDPRAEPFDAAVAKAFTHADTAALADLDPETSRELQMAGRAAWQVLAGAVAESDGAAGTVRITASELLAYQAPYGVGYLVATWKAAPPRKAAPPGEAPPGPVRS
jgi:hypothetical protein